MGTDAEPLVSEVHPQRAWEILSADTAAVLVDVRTQPEWTFVGGPDLSALGRDAIRLEWKSWPGMSQNPTFVGALLEQARPLPSAFLFLCRSGARSLDAAQAVASALDERGHHVPCINVAEGFEGDLDAEEKRGGLNGWKARGLAWRQS
ncbi:sulfurtransferase [Jannaschia pagri]|uniref:Sulfurtransferase n=1 Tax=Jannaschia pagri TaxID=2829797 RepID=A0ABQ4NQH3_9RHOB|nr:MULTISPECIES: rhodanese-like domain-containing protein [unclassified Jannaschia]GIT92783.1 sulfurtransferase [Jannaschia sp. AI_61]GIT96618.1 sulfurtransferase [Jannaschia sp. AI_62]